MNPKAEYAWHFLRNSQNKPILRDGRPLRMKHWYKHPDSIYLCESGYHASKSVLDALRYAPGTWVSLVSMRGRRIHAADKLVAEQRLAEWCFDAKEELGIFGRLCAAEVLKYCWPDSPITVDRFVAGDSSLINKAHRLSRSRMRRERPYTKKWYASLVVVDLARYMFGGDYNLNALRCVVSTTYSALRNANQDDGAYERLSLTLESILLSAAMNK
jgi:hypothetical protein